MEHLNLKKIFENNGIIIWQGRSRRDYSDDIKRVDNCFYIETKGKVRYTIFDAVKMLEYLFVNMVLESEREKVREILRRTFNL